MASMISMPMYQDAQNEKRLDSLKKKNNKQIDVGNVKMTNQNQFSTRVCWICCNSPKNWAENENSDVKIECAECYTELIICAEIFDCNRFLGDTGDIAFKFKCQLL